MSYSQAEKATIASISDHAYTFLRQNPGPQVAYFFSQYVSKEFLKLYFQSANGKDVFHDYLFALQQRQMLLSLECLKNDIHFNQIHQQMGYLQKAQNKLVFFAESKLNLKLESREETPELKQLEPLQSELQIHHEALLLTLASRMRSQQSQISKKVDQFLAVYHKTEIYAYLAFKSAFDLLSKKQNLNPQAFKYKVQENLLEYLGTPGIGFMSAYGLYFLSGLLLAGAGTVFALPYLGVALAFNANPLIIALLALGVVIAFANLIKSYYNVDPCDEKYSQMAML